MEALLRHGLFGGAGDSLPRLRSVVLIGAPSSTAIAENEARRLMRETEETVGTEEAPYSFWCRHNCAIYPQPECLKEAYAEAADRRDGWWCFGALQGWRRIQNWERRGGSRGSHSSWDLRGSSVLRGWEIARSEVSARFAAAAGGAPLLSIRGAHDFVTERCVEAWRGCSSMKEVTVGGCGHQPHLESPRVFAEALSSWFRRLEEGQLRRDGEAEARDEAAEPPLAAAAPRLLGREEARRELRGWASALARAPADVREAWAFKWRAEARRQEGRYWQSPVPCREAQRLAEWARGLPGDESPPGCQAPAQEGRTSRAAIGFAREGGRLDAIVCVEEDCVVGAVTAAEAPQALRTAAVRRVRELFQS